jgi:hypothetical protein
MITIDFLQEQGFEVIEDYPLHSKLQHKVNRLVFVSVGKQYGEITIGEKHWINNSYERTFSTTNVNLTNDDFNTICTLLDIKL